MIERTLAAGARPGWIVADSVYGGDSKLRVFLEEAEQPYVLAVSSQQSVWLAACRTLRATIFNLVC
jgi:SRSO17 transposase